MRFIATHNGNIIAASSAAVEVAGVIAERARFDDPASVDQPRAWALLADADMLADPYLPAQFGQYQIVRVP